MEQIKSSPNTAPRGFNDTEPLQPPPYAQVYPSTAHHGAAPNEFDNSAPMQHHTRRAKNASALSKAYRTYRASALVGGCVDILIVALCAVILSKRPDGLLLASAAYTIGAAGLSIPFMAVKLRPRAATDARPPFWIAGCVVISRVLVFASGILLIYNYAVRGDHDGLRTRDLHKRIYIGRVNATLVYRLALLAGCCGIASVLAGMRQVWIIKSIGEQQWNADDVRHLHESPRERRHGDLIRSMVAHR